MPRGYRVLVSENVEAFLQGLDAKSARICKTNLAKLSHPYPGRGPGDKEKIMFKGEAMYRLHISRAWTAFYFIFERERVVKVVDLMPIDIAHKKYGY